MRFSPDVILKYLLSFLKTDWTLKDYPIRVRHLPVPPNDAPAEFRPMPWLVQIIGWEQMPGTGNSRAAAFADLEERLAERKRQEQKLPRPGTRVPIAFAPRIEVEQHNPVAADFFARILDMAYQHVLITDESSLYHFGWTEERIAELQQKIQAVYGVEVADIEDGNLIRIFERIEQQGGWSG